jgi:signal transduction histidine kinase
MRVDTMGKTAAAFRGSIKLWWFAPALVLSLLMFGALSWHVYNTHSVERKLKADAGRTEEVRNRLCLFHQQLASNAVMVVASGDPTAEQRQRELTAGLAALIDKARVGGPEGYNLNALRAAHEAHQRLRGIEERAFALAKQGHEPAALALLSSAEYLALQDDFSHSAARFVDDYRSLLDDRLMEETHKELGSLAVAFAIFIVSVAVWLVLMTRLRRREQALVIEVAEREKAEASLQRREAVLSQAQEIAHLGSFDRDPSTGEERWSAEFYRILGYAPAAFPPSQQLFFERVHRDDLARLRRVAEAAATSTAGYEVEVRIVRPSGEERSVSLRAKLERDADGVVVRTVGTLYDSTEQKQIEARLDQSRQQLRSLAAHLLAVREQERAAVAKDIHDDVGQIVAAVRMDLAAVQRKLGPGHHQQQEHIEHIIGLLGQVVETVQRVMSELRPPVLDGVGLAAAIEWQLGQFQKRTGILCELVSDVEGKELSPDGNLALFRVLQEALNNVAQHAEASTVEVRLACVQDWLELEITDNGVGISETDLQDQQSFGILGMRERVQVVGGELQIRALESGTKVQVRAPITDAVAGAAIPLAP